MTVCLARTNLATLYVIRMSEKLANTRTTQGSCSNTYEFARYGFWTGITLMDTSVKIGDIPRESSLFTERMRKALFLVSNAFKEWKLFLCFIK